MKMAWLQAKEELGVEVVAPYRIELDGTLVTAIAYLPDFGSEKGTLVLEIEENKFANLAGSHGYFCSQLNPESYNHFNRRLYQKTLDDWQWFSKSKSPPSWYTGRSWS